MEKLCKCCGKWKPLVDFRCHFYDKTVKEPNKFSPECLVCTPRQKRKKQRENLTEVFASCNLKLTKDLTLVASSLL
jgi:hypothetical protein